jgi:hypothetical protein
MGRDQNLEAGGPGALFSSSPPRIVGITWDSVKPNVQDLDAQASPDAWIMEIQDYLKDNMLPDGHVSAERIVHVAMRYTLVDGDVYQCDANSVLMWCIT